MDTSPHAWLANAGGPCRHFWRIKKQFGLQHPIFGCEKCRKRWAEHLFGMRYKR